MTPVSWARFFFRPEEKKIKIETFEQFKSYRIGIDEKYVESFINPSIKQSTINERTLPSEP